MLKELSRCDALAKGENSSIQDVLTSCPLSCLRLQEYTQALQLLLSRYQATGSPSVLAETREFLSEVVS